MSTPEEIKEFLDFVDLVWTTARLNEEYLFPIKTLIEIFNGDLWIEAHRLVRTGRQLHNIKLEEVEHLLVLM
jgi:hypothetical protein